MVRTSGLALRLGPVAAFGLALGVSAPAHAWQIESVATTGCHERITASALAATGFPDGEASPDLNDEETRALNDVPFSLPDPALHSSWGLALMIGVRNNDLEQHDPVDVSGLSRLHNDPHKQAEHCLREIGDDGLMGNAIAIARCKTFILAELAKGFGTGADIDFQARDSVDTFLTFRGKIPLQLNRMAFHLGRAAHALEDSYTHQLRNHETDHVRTVLNWMEGNLGQASYDEARDGYPHIATVDNCALTDADTIDRETRSRRAATALFDAVRSPDGGNTGRLARASAALDQIFMLDEGCTVDNNYCDAPETKLAACGCGTGTDGSRAALLPMLIVGAALMRRRRRRVAAAGVAGAFALVLALPAGPAQAQPAPAPAPVTPAPVAPVIVTPPDPAPAVPTKPGVPETIHTDAPKSDVVEKAELKREDKVLAALPDPTTQKWGFAGTFGASIDRGGAALAVGGRYNPYERLGFGLDLEYNPWFSYSNFQTTAGVVNLYVPIIVKLRKFGSWELRSTFGIGGSYLLSQLVEANSGSIGVYANWNPLGIAVTVSPNWKLIIKPGDISVPIPALTGFPFYYKQYRLSIGFEFY